MVNRLRSEMAAATHNMVDTRDAVQRLVLEHGEYTPLELLLAINHVGYEDYRAWRKGELENLDAVLAVGVGEVIALLEAAQGWALALGLHAETTVHQGWEESVGSVLEPSAGSRPRSSSG